MRPEVGQAVCRWCQGAGRIDLISCWLGGLAPVWLAALAGLAAVLHCEIADGHATLALLVLLVAGLAAATSTVFLFYEGALSCLLRGFDLFCWIFHGKDPRCPRCRGRGFRSTRWQAVDAVDLVVTLLCVGFGMLVLMSRFQWPRIIR